MVRSSSLLLRPGRLALALALLSASLPALAEADAQEQGGSGPEADLAGSDNPAPAEEADFPLSSAPRIYLPADFASVAPRNALDLIEQIPGFDIPRQGGGGGFIGQNARGFGEASGNLLINGDRISSKSTSTSEQLARIPVEDVVRIEVVDGATLEIPGLSGRVANIIVNSSGLSGQFSWEPQYPLGPAPFNWREGAISIRGSSGPVDFTIALDSGGFQRGSDGPALFTFADGTQDERFNTQVRRFTRPELSGTFAIDLAPGVTANVNLSGGLTIFDQKERENRVPANPLPGFVENFLTSNREHFYELSADIEFPLGPGRLKLIGLESFEHGNFRTQSLLDLEPLPTSGSRFTRVSDQGERIARAEYSWNMWGGDWQLSGEAAFNRLDNVGSLFLYDAPSEEFVQIAFPAGIGGVREERYESILSFSRPLTDNLSLQLTLGGEYSTISQTGSNALSRTFQRPKGSLSLAWSPGSSLDISLEVARRVGQLNFGDFLASVNIADENQSVGNNQLRPEQSWETELEIARNFGPWGSATLTLFDYRIEDYLTIVPILGGGEASGNIDSAHRYGLRFNGTLQLGQLGWQGAKLDMRMTVEDSSLTDPVTLLDRRLDFHPPFEVSLELRHDVAGTDWAWGAAMRHTERTERFRVAEVTLEDNIATFGALFIEHKDVFGLTVQLRAANLFDGLSVLERTVYDGPRNVAPVLFTEDRRLPIGGVFNLNISGSF